MKTRPPYGRGFSGSRNGRASTLLVVKSLHKGVHFLQPLVTVTVRSGYVLTDVLLNVLEGGVLTCGTCLRYSGGL